MGEVMTGYQSKRAAAQDKLEQWNTPSEAFNKRSRYGRVESGRYTPYGAMAGVSLELRTAYYYYGWVHDADIPALPQPKWNPDTSVTPDEVLAEQQTVVEIGALLDGLTPRQKKVLRLRFGFNCHEHTLEEIGNIFEITRERIRQIEQAALRKLRVVVPPKPTRN